MMMWYVKTYSSLFATKKESEENCQNNKHDWNNNTNGYIGLLFSLFNEILQEKDLIPVIEPPQAN